MAAAMALLLISTIAAAQDLKCFILTPPEQLLEGVKKVAIMDFAVTARFHADDPPSQKKKSDAEILLEALVGKDKGKDEQKFADSGVKLADRMIALLLEEDRGIHGVGSGFLGLGDTKDGKSFQQGSRTDVFAVVERSRIAQVLNELQLGQSGLVDEAQAAQVGKILGVDAIITGNLAVSCDDRWSKEEREDKKRGKYMVDCHKRTASASASIRFIHIETGQVIGSKQSTYESKPETCSEKMTYDLPAPEATIAECLQAVAAELVNYFAPRFEMQKMEFAKIEGDAYKRMRDDAKRVLDRYELDQAYVLYTAIVEQDPYNHAALFNLGVLNEAVGNYQQAQEQYALAYKLKSKEKKYSKAQTRAAKQVAFWEKLSALDIFLQPRTFAVSTEQMQVAAAPRIQVIGSGADRIAIRAASDPTSPTLVKVPGEIELELVAASADWYKIKLLDGREGYLAKKNGKILK
jgi:tetratricopeptide (TPR) repeat protein